MPFGIRPSNVRVCHSTTRAFGSRWLPEARRWKIEDWVASGLSGDGSAPPGTSNFDLRTPAASEAPLRLEQSDAIDRFRGIIDEHGVASDRRNGISQARILPVRVVKRIF